MAQIYAHGYGIDLVNFQRKTLYMRNPHTENLMKWVYHSTEPNMTLHFTPMLERLPMKHLETNVFSLPSLDSSCKFIFFESFIYKHISRP